MAAEERMLDSVNIDRSEGRLIGITVLTDYRELQSLSFLVKTSSWARDVN